MKNRSRTHCLWVNSDLLMVDACADRRVRSDFSFIYWSKLGALRVTQVGGAKPQIAKLDCCAFAVCP